MDFLQISAGAVLLILALAGIYFDTRFRRLPNSLCGVLLLSGLTFVFVQHGGNAVGMAALHAGLALAVGIALFAGHMIGAGDAKYYAAIAAWFPLKDAIQLLLLVSLTGLVVVIAWLLLRKKLARPGPRAEADLFSKVPYGLPISLGAALAYFML